MLSPGISADCCGIPGEKEAFEQLVWKFHFREPSTPVLLKDFIAGFPASNLRPDAELLLADWYYFNQDFPSALIWYAGIPDNAFSGDVRDGMLYRKALSLLKSGYYREAEMLFASLVRSDKFGLDSEFYLAYIRYVDGDYDEAFSRFSNLKKRHARDSEIDWYINQIDFRKGNFTNVASTSDRLLTLTEIPVELKGETMRVGGLSYFKLGDTAKARRLLADYTAFAGDGAEISALYALGSIYYDEGNLSGALPLFTVVTEYPGELAQSAWLYIGQIHLQQDNPQAAAMAFDKAASESWNGDVAQAAAYNLAVTSASGMALPFSDSALAMENFIDSYPSSPYAASLSSYLANAYYARRDYDKALRQIDRIGTRDSATRATRQKILYQLGLSLLRQGDANKASAALGEAAEGPERDVAAQAELWLGDARYASKDYRGAASAYGKAISSGLLGDNTALAQYDLGYANLKLHDYKKAESAFKAALDAGSLNAGQLTDARLRYADCLYYNGRYAQALALFRDIKLGGGTDAVFAQVREADILGREGKVGEKIAILERLVDNPEAGIWLPTVLSRLADAYSEKGDDKNAARLYAEMLDSNGNFSDNTQTYFSLATNAENLYKAGDAAAAYAAYKRLETSGIAALYPAAVTGVMRTASEPSEIAEYALKVSSLPGISADETDEAIFTGATASLSLGGHKAAEARKELDRLARSSDRYWGARAAVELGENLLEEGDPKSAEEILLHLADNGSDDNYWMARGYIALADASSALGKDYIARLYLENLRSNYPGDEKDIIQMINLRLKRLEK